MNGLRRSSKVETLLRERDGNDCYIATQWFLLDTITGELLVKVEKVDGWYSDSQRSICSPHENEETLQAWMALKETENAY